MMALNDVISRLKLIIRVDSITIQVVHAMKNIFPNLLFKTATILTAFSNWVTWLRYLQIKTLSDNHSKKAIGV